MTELDLALMRDNDSVKCRNCQRFTRLPATDAIGKCSLGDFVTSDLALCTAWVRAVDPVIEVRSVGARGNG